MEYWVNDGKVIVATHKIEDVASGKEVHYAESISRKDAIVSWMQNRADNPITSPVITTTTAPTTDERNVLDMLPTKGIYSREDAKMILQKTVTAKRTPTDIEILKAIQGIPL